MKNRKNMKATKEMKMEPARPKELTKELVRELLDEERSGSTIEKYLRDVKQFMDYLGENQIEKERIREYKEILKERYKISSANSMLAAINSFFVFIGRAEG